MNSHGVFMNLHSIPSTSRHFPHPSSTIFHTPPCHFFTTKFSKTKGVHWKPRTQSIVARTSIANEGNHHTRNPNEEEFDAIEQFLVSSRSMNATSKKNNGSGRTPLEVQAQAIAESSNMSLRDRADAMNALLDSLEQKGIPTAYAFEFIRYAGNLIDALIAEAKNTTIVAKPQEQNCQGSANNRNLQNDNQGNIVKLPSSLASKVYDCAERRGLARFVAYFQILNMRASEVPKLIPFCGKTLDSVMAKVEFLRRVGIQQQNFPIVLASWPQLLSLEVQKMALVVDFFESNGLSKREIVSIITKHPSVLGQSVELDLQRTVQFLQEIGSSPKDVKALLARHPAILVEDVDSKLGVLVDYLVSSGIQVEHIGPLLAKRKYLINGDIEKNILPLIDYLKTLNATANDIDKIITSFPTLFYYDIEKDIKPAVAELESIGVKPRLVAKIFRRFPQLLKNRMKFGTKVKFLLRLGLKKEDLGHVIFNAPQLLGLTEEKLKTNVKFLESLGLKGPSLYKVLLLKPMILAYSIEGKLQPNANFLQNIGIDNQDICRIVTRCPQLITLSITKNLEPTFSHLLQLGFTREELACMVRRLPSLLSFSVINVLDPKFIFLSDVMKRSPKELVQFPQYFSYSLDKRIIPRFSCLGENHVHYSLSAIFGCNDADFRKKSSSWNHRQRLEISSK